MEEESKDLDYLATLIDAPTPAFLNELPSEQLNELRHYVEAVVTRDEAGLDKLFESMSMMMKFIPNFILHSLTPKYTEPAIAARITAKLTVKQSLGVTGGLPSDYVGETSVYMKPQHAAEILQGLKKDKIKSIVAYMVEKHPLKALDIFEYLSEETRQLCTPFTSTINIDEATLNHSRKATLNTLKNGNR